MVHIKTGANFHVDPINITVVYTASDKLVNVKSLTFI